MPFLEFMATTELFSDYDYRAIVEQSQLVVDTRNATKGIDSAKIVRC